MMFLHLETVTFEKVGVARFFKSSINYRYYTYSGEKTPLTLFLHLFCYSESFIRVFISRNESPESTQLDIEL